VQGVEDWTPVFIQSHCGGLARLIAHPLPLQSQAATQHNKVDYFYIFA
jgi:hypothetical protein